MQCGNTTIGIIGRAGENLELHILHQVSDIDQFKRTTQIGAIVAKAAHRLGVAHTRKWIRKLYIQHIGEECANHLLHHTHDLLFIDKGHLHIDLGKFRLAIGSQILVTKTAHNLVVTVHARHHQQLLEELRRLRQGKKFAIVGAAGHQVVASTLGCGACQHRCFNIEKTPVIEKMTQMAGDCCAQLHAFLHLVAAQIDIAIAQTQIFTNMILVHLDRWSLGMVQNFKLFAQNLDFACRQIRIGRPFRTLPDQSLDAQHKLIAYMLGCRKDILDIGVIDDLHQTLPVTKIDKNHPAMITPPMNPSTEFYCLTNMISI